MSNPIGINTWNWVSPLTTENLKVYAPKIKALGFDVLEVPLEDVSYFDAPVVKQILEDNELGTTVCGAFGPSRDLASDDPAAVKGAHEFLRETIEFTAAIGGTVVGGPMYSTVGKARKITDEQRKVEFDRSAVELVGIGVFRAVFGHALAER